MDGQTLPQPGVFGSLVKRSVHLPEVHTAEDEWYCNRLANEALLELTHHGMGPVHINVPVSEPFFQLPVHALPTVRVIHRYTDLGQLAPDGASLSAHFNRYHRRMAVVGQTAPTGRCGGRRPIVGADGVDCRAVGTSRRAGPFGGHDRQVAGFGG